MYFESIISHMKVIIDRDNSYLVPWANTGTYACGVLYQTVVASAGQDTLKQENSKYIYFYMF